MTTGLQTLRGSCGVLGVNLVDQAQNAKAPGWLVSGLSDVVTDAMTAVATLDQARGELVKIRQDGGISEALRGAKIRDALGYADVSSRSYLATARATADKLQARLWKEAAPPRPEGASDVALLDRKADILALIEKAPSASDALFTLLQLTKRAVAESDGLTLFTVGGGPLRFAYERLGLDVATLESSLAQIGISPLSELKALWRGAKSVPAFLAMAAHVVDMALSALRAEFEVPAAVTMTGEVLEVARK